MKPATEPSWSDDERDLLDGLLDRIIPASADGRVPSAGTLGIAEFLSTATAKDAELAALFRHGLARASVLAAGVGDMRGAPTLQELAEHLELREPVFFAALLRHTYMGYYSRADVRPLFGPSARPTQPDGYAVPPESLEEIASLVSPVTARGACYRATPVEGGARDGQ